MAVQIAEDEVPAPKGRTWVHLLLTLAGLAVIVVGADLLVRGSVDLSRAFGVSEAVIGLTVVAIGTSAPELVTTLVSTFRGDRDIAIGNLIGSSTYNIGLVLGSSALVAPLAVTPELVHVDLPVMAAVMLLCIPVFLTGRRMSRGEGIGFVLGVRRLPGPPDRVPHLTDAAATGTIDHPIGPPRTGNRSSVRRSLSRSRGS